MFTKKLEENIEVLKISDLTYWKYRSIQKSFYPFQR